MALELDNLAITKLSHESSEIRLRSLEQIYNKLSRSVEHNEKLQFKVGELCKQLIRWFAFEPLLSSKRVLQLLLLILRSEYSDQAIRRMGVERFKREMEKVKLRIKNQATESKLVDEIIHILCEYKNINKDKETEVIEVLDSLSIKASDDIGSIKNDKLITHFGPNHFEPAWSKITPADFTALKFIADLLSDENIEKVEVKKALLHFEVTMQDYPAEYMLQAPHVLLKLINLYRCYDEIENTSIFPDVARSINVFLRLFLKRLKMRCNINAYSVDTAVSEIHGNTQLKVDTVLQLIFEKSIQQLDMLAPEFHKDTRIIVEIIENCLKLYDFQQLAIDTNVLTKLHTTIIKLQKCFERDDHFTLQRIYYLLLVCLLDDILIHNTNVQPADANNGVLEFILRDYTFKENFPRRYKNIEQRISKEVLNDVGRYQKLQQYDNCIRAAVSLLKNPQGTESIKIITNGLDIYFALENLKSVQLAERMFNAIIDCNKNYISQPELRTKANQLLMHLLRLKYEPLKVFIYKMLVMTVKRHFACLMECERYCIGLTHGQLLESQILGIPLSSELLVQLVHECGKGAKESIRKISEDTLALILKSENLLGEHWTKLLELLLPVLPLLQCCTQSPSIIQLLQSLFHPDAKQLPFLAALQGNIIFMFYNDSAIRSEALTRLIYMMNSVPDANKYVPNLLYISDVIPNDLCILKMPREYKRIFSDITDFYEKDTLHNLLNMLEMSDVEPVIRKTTLLQLNIMCQQWHTLRTFCEEGAHYLILRALENSMLVASYEDYTGAAIPAIGILCKVLLYDASLRCELSDTPNIYILILRALCLYQNDIQLRQDACICLFLLLYSSFLVVLGDQRIEAPNLLGNLKLPLSLELQSFEQNNMSPMEFKNIFQNETESIVYLRHLIAETLSEKQVPVPKQYLEEQKNYDFDRDLQLTLRDWRLMKATNFKCNIQRFLHAILNATNHQSLINASISIQLQLLVQDEQIEIVNPLLSDKFADELYNLIGKYLQLPPGNESDYALFEELLDLCHLCVLLPSSIICTRLVKELIADFNHAIIVLLKSTDTSLRLYSKLCMFLGDVMKTVKCISGVGEELCILHSNLFEMIFQLITQFFQKRDLLRIRCLLHVQNILSAKDLSISDIQLISYCKCLIKLSLALKSFTQTGAQWQIDCLTIVCQLYRQFDEPTHNFKLKNSTVKYLSGLCGHCDRQVRALAWCILTYVSRYDDNCNDQNNSLTYGTDFLIKELSYLPGGFMACCLSTLLDVGETIIVRQLASNLFIAFLKDATKYEDAYQLLMRHQFLAFADESIRGNCLFEQSLPLHIDANSAITITNCDLVSYFCRICLKMLQINGDYVNELCDSDFMMRLYEVLKIPAVPNNPAYYIMCGDICHLYGACYPAKFYFLQRTLCRDHVWLMSFYQLLDQPLASDPVLVNIIQLLMVLCKDNLAYEKLCKRFAKAPEFLVKHFLRAFTIRRLNTPLQRSSLAALSLLLIKDQNGDKPNSFVAILGKKVEITESGAKVQDDQRTSKTTSKDYIDINNSHLCNESEQLSAYRVAEFVNDNSENITAATTGSSTSAETVNKSAAALIFVELFRLFQHLYSITACKFDNAPTKTQVQVCETLSVLLSLSLEARLAARNLKLFDKITHILNTFFEQFKCSATTYVRRYGEKKKMVLVKNFQLLLNMHLNWFAAPDAALKDNLQSIALSKFIMQLWPWLTYAGELKELVLLVCSYHSEHSFAVCQQFSVLFSGYAHSLLQLIIKLVVVETSRIKSTKAESFPVISTALRVIMNCCSCAEGRVTIIKAHMLDMFDSLYPFHLKSPKLKTEILCSWLRFWELFSRYPEGGNARNVRALCDVVLRSATRSTTRILTLRILRNMCFLPGNRSTLMASTDFICTLDTIISIPLNFGSMNSDITECESYEEQLIVCVGIWKLSTSGAKYVAMLRSTNLAKHIRKLRDQLATLEEIDPIKFTRCPFAPDLCYVLDVILHIFSN